MVQKKASTAKKKIKKIPSGRGIINCHSSYNNTILNLSEENGNVLVQVSAGSSGYKGTKKGTYYAAEQVAEQVIRSASDYEINQVKLRVRGVGTGREAVLKKIREAKTLQIEEAVDQTPVSFAQKKPRRK